MTATNENLISVALRVSRGFELAEQVDKEGAILNEHQRFQLWARSIGLYRTAHNSLDYRLRDCPLLLEYTLNLLHNLEHSLTDYGRDESDDEEAAISGPDSDVVDVSDESDEDLSSYRDQPLSAALVANIVTTIDRLCRLAFEVRNPSIRLGLSKGFHYTEIDPDTGVDVIQSYAVVDLRHVMDIFHSFGHPIGDDPAQLHYLILRLAKANTRRRQQFMYWQKDKLDSRLIPLSAPEKEPVIHVDLPSLPISNPMKDHSAPPVVSVSSTFAPSEGATTRGEPHDETSTTTTLSLIELYNEKNSDDVIIPSPPFLPTGAEEFQCPYCCFICPASTLTASRWETHIFRDLRPYICTHHDCADPDQQYDRLADWIAHETTNHRQGNTRTCPFCSTEASTPAHVARHLRRVASFALPRSRSGDEGSVAIKNERANHGNVPLRRAFSFSRNLPGPQANSTAPEAAFDREPLASVTHQSLGSHAVQELQRSEESLPDAPVTGLATELETTESPAPSRHSLRQQSTTPEEGAVEEYRAAYNLGQHAREGYVQTGSMDDLKQAIEYAKEALISATTRSPRRRELSMQLAGLLAARYELHGDSDDLDGAIVYAQSASDDFEKDTPEDYTATHEVARLVELRYTRSGNLDDLDRAIQYTRSIANEVNKYETYYGLGKLFVLRYQRTESANDLEQAIESVSRSMILAKIGNSAPFSLALGLGRMVLRQWQTSETIGHTDDMNLLMKVAISRAGRDTNNPPLEKYELHYLFGQVLVMLWSKSGYHGYLEDAGGNFDEAFAGLKSVYGFRHEATIDAMEALGAVYWDRGRPLEALDMYTSALEQYTVLLGPEHSKTTAARERWEQIFNHYKTRTSAEALDRVL